MPKHYIDLTGKRFGRLVAVSRFKIPGKPYASWRCVCDCGKKTATRTGYLTTGITRSCGCLVIDTSRANWNKVRTHGWSKTPTYKIWIGMRRRCEAPNDPDYKHYGARGILVCESWHKFEVFLADMGPKPQGKSIERINNNGPYAPENCIWADQTRQQNNKRSNVWLTTGGRCLTISQWSRLLRIKHSTIRERLRRGYSVERALSPTNFRNHRIVSPLTPPRAE